MNRFYVFIRTIIYPFVRFLFPFTLSGIENVPNDAPVVLCANHASGWDPILILVALPRKYRVRIMAKKELFDIPVLGFLLGKLGCFPVNRGHSDLSAVKTAIKTVRNGDNLLIFPEGTRVDHPGEVRPKGGVVMIAMRTGAAMLPIYVGGKKRLFRRSHIVFGTPYKPETAARHGTAEEYQEHADEILRRIYALGGE